MATSVQTNGVVTQAERQLGRPWAVVSLSLVFELPDGRKTEPTYIAGSAFVDLFLRRFGASKAEDLVGTAMHIEVREGDPRPVVVEVMRRATVVPEAYRAAFEGEDASSGDEAEA